MAAAGSRCAATASEKTVPKMLEVFSTFLKNVATFCKMLQKIVDKTNISEKCWKKKKC
jgi:hypothetical protein